MVEDWAAVSAEVALALAEVGQVGAIKRITPPDPVLGGDAVPQTFPAKLVPMTYDQRFIDGTNIKAADREIYISSVGLGIVPEPGDVAWAGGVDYLIIAVDPNNYDGQTSVVYIVQGRA